MSPYARNQILNWIWVALVIGTLYGCTIYILGDISLSQETTGVEINKTSDPIERESEE